MNRKVLIALALASIATQAYALEIYKGRLVSHKEWSTGNAKATFKMSKLPNKFKKQATDRSYSYAFSQGQASKGVIGIPATINGSHQVGASNNSSKTQVYSYTLSICAATSDHNSLCAYYYDSIELQPGGYFSSQEEPYLEATFDQPGSFATFVDTHLQTETLTPFDIESYVQTSSNSSSTVEISGDNAKK